MKTLKLVIMASILLVAAQARASLYDLTYSGGGTAASGWIDVVGGAATSGSLTVSAGTGLGTYTLDPTIGYQNDGQFEWDNSVAPTSNPFLDSNGLMFIGGGYEVNLWANGPGNYSLYGNVGGNYHPLSDGGLATLTAVPEPTTIISGMLMLLPFGASTLRILRRRQVA